MIQYYVFRRGLLYWLRRNCLLPFLYSGEHGSVPPDPKHHLISVLPYRLFKPETSNLMVRVISNWSTTYDQTNLITWKYCIRLYRFQELTRNQAVVWWTKHKLISLEFGLLPKIKLSEKVEKLSNIVFFLFQKKVLLKIKYTFISYG